MSAWALFTWLSIAVLVLGSIGVFLWFLRDAWRIYRSVSPRAERARSALGAEGSRGHGPGSEAGPDDSSVRSE